MVLDNTPSPDTYYGKYCYRIEGLNHCCLNESHGRAQAPEIVEISELLL